MALSLKEAKSWLEREAFIRFAETLYKDYPNYCVPVYDEQRKFISAKHPFRAHGDASLLMVYDDKKIVARAMVSFDPRLKAQTGRAIAHVGLFEAVDDLNVSRFLLTACQSWAKEKHGATILRGPVDYSLNYPIGMYLGPHDAPQRILMNFHPPYYPKLWEDFGFAKAIDFFSWWGKTPDKIDRWVEKVQRITADSKVSIRHLTRRTFKKDLLRAQDFIGTILEANPDYVRMTDLEHRSFVKELQFVPPELVMIAEDGGKIVGLLLTLPDFNEAIRPLRGKLFPYFFPSGVYKFYSSLKKIKTARVALLGVDQAYRFDGIAERMIVENLMIGRAKFKFGAAEIGWTFEDNTSMINNVNNLGLELKKTYRVYDKQI